MKAKIIEINLLDHISRASLDKISIEIDENPKTTVKKILKKYDILYPHREPFLLTDLIEFRKLSK